MNDKAKQTGDGARDREIDPAADLERGRSRPETNPRKKAQHEGDVVHDEPDPMEVDPGIPPRSPI